MQEKLRGKFVHLSRETILNAVFIAIDDINQLRASDKQIPKSKETVLFGTFGSLDSLGLVSLIVSVVEQIQEIFGVPIVLADERAMSQQRSPFRSVESLADYIEILLKEAQHG